MTPPVAPCWAFSGKKVHARLLNPVSRDQPHFLGNSLRRGLQEVWAYGPEHEGQGVHGRSPATPIHLGSGIFLSTSVSRGPTVGAAC